MPRTTCTTLMTLLAACALCACGVGQIEETEPTTVGDSVSVSAAAAPGTDTSSSALSSSGDATQTASPEVAASTDSASVAAAPAAAIPAPAALPATVSDAGTAIVATADALPAAPVAASPVTAEASAQTAPAEVAAPSPVASPAAPAVVVVATNATATVPSGSVDPAPAKAVAAASPAAASSSATFVHPGLLHTRQDLERMQAKVAGGYQPWTDGWHKLLNNPHASLGWRQPNPQPIVYRGKNPTHAENYAALYQDIAAAYALALRWKISHDDAYADKAIAILNAWSSTLTAIDGSSDRFLASGIYGYELANAAELMRGYPKWASQDFARIQATMLNIFYPMNHDFLVRHNGAKIDHYWANWDLANMASMLAIGVLTDRRDIYDEAVEYFKHGAGNGAIGHLVWKLHPNGLGQIQESGRDQGHSTLDIALLGSICQMAWSQGDDLFGYDQNRALRGAEYVAQYNLGNDVPYASYTNSDVTQAVISDAARGTPRPIWELFYNHYVVLKGLSAPNVKAYAEKARAEGGGGDYGGNSGGFDQLGYGTLTFSLP